MDSFRLVRLGMLTAIKEPMSRHGVDRYGCVVIGSKINVSLNGDHFKMLIEIYHTAIIFYFFCLLV